MTQAGPVAEVRSFLDSYIDYWGSDRFASLYHAPSITLRADGSIHCFLSTEEISGFFKGIYETYSREGSRRWKYENLDVVLIGGRSVLVSLDWFMMRDDESLIRRWRQSYNLVRIDGKFRVLVSTFHIA